MSRLLTARTTYTVNPQSEPLAGWWWWWGGGHPQGRVPVPPHVGGSFVYMGRRSPGSFGVSEVVFSRQSLTLLPRLLNTCVLLIQRCGSGLPQSASDALRVSGRAVRLWRRAGCRWGGEFRPILTSSELEEELEVAPMHATMHACHHACWRCWQMPCHSHRRGRAPVPAVRLPW